jgi:hypothetical protein
MQNSIIKNLFIILISSLASLESLASWDMQEPTENVGGFIAGTIVHTFTGPDTIQNIRINDRLLSFSPETGEIVHSLVTHIHRFQVHELAKLVISGETFYLNPDHRFYIPVSSTWISARDLEIGFELIDNVGEHLVVESKELILGNEWLYDLTVEETENYFVGNKKVLVHNFAFVIPIVTWVIGEGIVWASVATVALLVGTAIVATEISRRSSNKQGGVIESRYDGTVNRYNPQCDRLSDCDSKESSYRTKSTHSTDSAQAPGIPSSSDGFKPAKNWDGKSKVRAPNGRGYGYPDDNGNVWVPTGTKPSKAHGGPHWDVQDAKGKKYENIYPGGKKR